MDFFAISFVERGRRAVLSAEIIRVFVLHIFCLCTSMEQILMPNCSLLHLHSIDVDC